MTNIDEMLDGRMKGGGDYPPWWEPEAEGDTLEGLVTEKREDPWADENDDEDPGHILHVLTTQGDEYSTRTHKVLTNLIKEQNVEVRDFVRIEYMGKEKTDSGHQAYNYRLGVIKESELEDLDIEIPTADGGTTSDSGGSGNEEQTMTPAEAGAAGVDPSEANIESSNDDSDDESADLPIDPEEHTVDEVEDALGDIDDPIAVEALLEAEKNGDDRVSAKSVISDRFKELTEGTDGDEDSTDVPGEAVEFVESLISFHGELDESDLDEYLNSTRDFGVNVDDVAEAAGLTKNDDGLYVEE